MSVIYVRTKIGRVARTSPRGDLIPHDRFIPVRPDGYINRLLNVHGDIEIKPADDDKKSHSSPASLPKGDK